MLFRSDGAIQISITDAGPKLMALGTATSNGFKIFDIRVSFGRLRFCFCAFIVLAVPWLFVVSLARLGYAADVPPVSLCLQPHSSPVRCNAAMSGRATRTALRAIFGEHVHLRVNRVRRLVAWRYPGETSASPS